MTTPTVDRPITPLRQRMLTDMALRGLTSDMQRDYIRLVARPIAGFRSWRTACATRCR